MALNRIEGNDELYVGGVFGLRRPGLVQELGITHVLSVIKYTLPADQEAFRNTTHMTIDIDDMDDQDILVYLPRMVRFIERGLYGHDISALAPRASNNGGQGEDPDAILPAGAEDAPSAQLGKLRLTPADGQSGRQKGAVLVHCAMGKSRSVTAVVAYLLWKYPHRFGSLDTPTTSNQKVWKAVEWVRKSRPIAEPNDGFMQQLEMWVDMGCPADSDDAVEREPAYQRWLYKREVEDAARIGRAPDWIRFEDEETEKEAAARQEKEKAESGMELRCKKCRRMLANKPFVIPHQGRGKPEQSDCPHYFVEALSWMRPVLELGELEGRLVCPNTKCGASVGRYAWQGFKCSCGEWVAPAISLQKSKVDEVMTGGNRQGNPAAANANRMAALGIRMPPGMQAAARKENL
ncbi:tyrosine-protein phosphatase [Rhypophila decipiens]|uniref:protein-tyrosine-phosphatase n=1 Tax=Rhypophila decipiens TaxID=261697 RepID=A0AAN6Y941_9PEZI|nr:tyrosine-protein phosphatase [Rhypophila decipiens]